jgi:hypothetical protein
MAFLAVLDEARRERWGYWLPADGLAFLAQQDQALVRI